LYLLNLRKHSTQVELDQFFSQASGGHSGPVSMTKSAFFQARKKLSHHALIDLNDQVIDAVYERKSQYKRWKGFRLCAVDGTTIRLPHETDIIDTFGVHPGKENQKDCARGIGSVYYDVLNHLMIDSGLHPSNASEKECATQHLIRSLDNDLILYDRGYGAFWFYALHLQQKRNFCMRIKTRQYRVAQDFIDSGEPEAIIELTANHSSRKTCEEKGLSDEPITLRMIRVDLPNEVEVLITSLTNKDVCPVGIFKSLYHLRWGIEENYKRLKQWAEIENFSGKSSLSVEQDFYAKILATNLTALMALEAQTTVSKKTRKRGLRYQVNFAQALSAMKHKLVLLVRATTSKLTELIGVIVEHMSERIEAIRPGRKAPRRIKSIKNKLHFSAYKCSL
jgi:hypothetical protein